MSMPPKHSFGEDGGGGKEFFSNLFQVIRSIFPDFFFIFFFHSSSFSCSSVQDDENLAVKCHLDDRGPKTILRGVSQCKGSSSEVSSSHHRCSSFLSFMSHFFRRRSLFQTRASCALLTITRRYTRHINQGKVVACLRAELKHCLIGRAKRGAIPTRQNCPRLPSSPPPRRRRRCRRRRRRRHYPPRH